jgi:transposase
MARQRRYFPPEFKAEAVRLSRESGRSVTAVARELGIRPDLLREWRRVVPAAEAAAPGAGSLAEEVRRLKRENEVLRQERDFLKRAAAYFAKGPQRGTP